jgi:hypothetical protein
MKKLQLLTKSKVLSKKEQNSVRGGRPSGHYIPSACVIIEDDTEVCPEGQHCEDGTCVLDHPNS